MEPRLEQPKTEESAKLAQLRQELSMARAFGREEEVKRLEGEIGRIESEKQRGLEPTETEIFEVGLERIYEAAKRLGEKSEFGRGEFLEYFAVAGDKEKLPRFASLLERKFGGKIFVPWDLAHQAKPDFGIGGDVLRDVPSGQLIFVGDSGIILKIVNEPERKEKGLVVSRETIGIEVCKIPPRYVKELKKLAR